MLVDKPWWMAGGITPGTCIAAYQPAGAMSLAASYTNLANPGKNNAAPGTAPAWDAVNGWSFTGFQFLTSGITPIYYYYSIAVRYSDSPASDVGLLGGYYTTAADCFAIFPLYMSSFIFANNNDGQIAPGASAGVMAMAGKSGYHNGKKYITIAGTTNNISGTINIAGGQTGRYRTCKIQAFAVYNITLTETQVAELTNRMQSL